jgi:hypothetical protein
MTIALRYLPPANEQDFERLCLLLLREHWKCPDVELFGRKGQSQQGIDILDLAGRERPIAAQCKNYDPLKAFTVGQLKAVVWMTCPPKNETTS